MKKVFLLLGLLFCLASAQAENKILPEQTIKDIETELEKQIAETRPTVERQYYLFLLAGRELLNYRYYDASEKYYTKALALKYQANHSEAHLKLLGIAVIKQDQEAIDRNFALAQDYYKVNPKLLNAEIKEYLDFVSVTYLKNADKQTKNKVFKGFYGHYAQSEEVESWIKEGSYTKALLAYNPKGLEAADIGTKVTYDLLNVVVNRNKTKSTLLCEKSYSRYPNAYSYSVLICGSLKKYLKNGKLEKQDLKLLEDYFKSNHEDRKYLLNALKELSV